MTDRTDEQPFGYGYQRRPEYVGDDWLVRWWSKDGAWHVAIFDPEVGYKRWTDRAFNTSDEALAYVEAR